MTSRSRLDGMPVALSAVRNASSVPAGAADVESILRTGAGHPSHLRALFGDTSLETLMRLAIAMDIPTATLLAAYRAAKATAAAANAEIEAEGWG